MAFGLLGSIIPQVNKNEVLYTASFPNLTFGKVSISNKNYSPSKVRLGITTDNINIEYLEYNRFINYGETFESETIYLGDTQKLVVRSSDPNVNFLFYGETIDETTNPIKSGLLSSIVTTNNQKQILYVAPPNSKVTLSLSICNLDSQPAKARIGISTSGVEQFNSSEYLEYDAEIGPHQTYKRTVVKLNAGQSLICSSSEDSNLNFVCHGILSYEKPPGFVVVKDDDAIVGTASTINFGANIKATFFGGVSTITTSDNVSIANSFTAASGKFSVAGATGNTEIVGSVGINSTLIVSGNINALNNVSIANSFSAASGKFSVAGATGNTQITGTLGISSTLTVSGNINALNNKVINVGSATSSTDATNKSYVDTRSIAMSIALS